MGIHPQLPTPAMRSVIKIPMRTVVVLLIDRFPQVVRAMWGLGLTYLLRRIAGLAEIPITEPPCQLIALNDADRAGAAEAVTTVDIASLTQIAIGPKISSTLAAAASTWSASATSVGRTSALPPSSSTSRRAPSNPACPRATRPRWAPRLAKARAMARPTPAEAPVTTDRKSVV